MIESKSFVVIHKEFRRSGNPDDIRSPLKRWKAVLYQFGQIPLDLESWSVPFSAQPRARLSKSRRNAEEYRSRLQFKDLGSE